MSTTGLSKQQQAELLRRYGHEDEAVLVETGQLEISPDALKTSWFCLQVSDALQELADSFSRPWWQVTVREHGSLASVRIQADSEVQAAFLAGPRFGRNAEIVGVEAAAA